MKTILPEFEFTDEQLNIVNTLSTQCGLCPETVKILYGRGLKDKDSIVRFMHPSKENFISPFKMRGMREAVELIQHAKAEGWVVAVFGDYDADGICASTIMAKSLRDFGIEPIVCVPERKNGYGLSVELIDYIFDEYFPQLVITVDCGISCASEVEYIKELGAEVIVTDHHELPEKIPECICINPKFNDEYIYDNLCGAGVAFKVGCALNGENAYKYLDFAAIATVADSVPLTGENRDIVSEGLKLINANPAECYLHFLKSEDNITSQTLAFTIAPKINAAGRMGDAKAALELFNETDKNRILDLSAKLTAYNLERQKYCDELYTSAKEMISESGCLGNIIMLYNENWNAGFVGIVAARLADEYSRPVILFVKNGELLKGSARSIENVNIYEALKACGEYIAEFGGHSQAAGVNVVLANFKPLYEAINKYLSQNYNKEDFIPKLFINGRLDGIYRLKFVKELELLEPFGVGNRRPMFVTEENSLCVRAVKANSPHISLKSEKIELMFFSGAKYKRLIESAAPKKFIFEYNLSKFRGKEYIKGFVRDIIYDNNAFVKAETDIALGFINMLTLPQISCKINEISVEDIEELLIDRDDGILFVAWDYASLAKFKNYTNQNIDLFVPTSKNFASVILLSPSVDADLSGYKRIIILDGKGAGVRMLSLAGKNVEICTEMSVPAYIHKLSCVREDLLSVFAAVSANASNLTGATAEEVVLKNNIGFDKLQIFFAMKVFEQLGLLTFENGFAEVKRGVKSRLENSELYNVVTSLKAE